jgi:serine/threonine protein kinase/formylglycine-generating enzyme required for sulfatase activity
MNERPDTLRTTPEGEGRPVADTSTSAAALPAHVGRYRVERLLGEGGFGRVYLARDEQLQRLVAVKVPHPHLIASPEDADTYLAEARTAAGLDHPHIVPVFDVGGTPELPCFIVSKFIEGRTLAWAIRHDRPAPAAAAALVAAVADALQHAHQHGVVHRDVKPSNVLLDNAGRPFVADFGLALREQDVGRGPRYAGTPAYMSPEQARGEGHRVDGRTDVFSLGAVFYELLTGRRPFQAGSREELLEQIASHEPRPPRQWDDTIPKELERICLKALAKRAAERYTTARDLADDLRHAAGCGLAHTASDTSAKPQAATELFTPIAPLSDSTPLRIIPKGLRPFDAHDADFFLELLPGPRDREGLPDSVRFWKTRIEETDPDNTFAVGLLYGPSGCGKSSLVRAGLLPRLSADVIAVYVEATAQETEPRLLNGLRKRCPALPAHLGLKEALAALRRGQGLPAGKKVLLVLDQFEQWLHARKEENTELVQALRQCDGGRVQGVVLVRDDFWMAVTRFLRELEIRLVEGQNSAAVDLFPVRHAEKVLAAFGRAFGAFPGAPADAGEEQKRFLEQAVSGLSHEGKVICVRLALFAEMMKGKSWAPATLKDVGGTEGVGAAFLEETFSAATAPPEHRYHQKAARAVLQALLPEAGTDIKGHMRSRQELLAASGYDGRPKDFDALLRTLDGELRLITPTDPDGAEDFQARSASEESDVASLALRAGQQYYQLTHDYLVHSLRDWLTRKQKETRRGRAELLLADRAAVWSARPEKRQLPSLLQWLQIRCLTRKTHWTPPQRQMMRKATRLYVVRGLLTVVLLGLVGRGIMEVSACFYADMFVGALRSADTAQLPALLLTIERLEKNVPPPFPSRVLLLSRLRTMYEESGPESRERLHASLALLPVDPGQVEYLYGRLLTADPQQVVVMRDALRPHAEAVTERLWAVLEDAKGDPGRRLRAACVLAAFAPDDGRWEKVRSDVARRLVAENALVVGKWAEALQPVGRHLLPPLAVLLQDEKRSAAERRTITGLYAGYAGGAPNAFAPLEEVLAERSGPQASAEARLALARRQANAAVALAALGRWQKVAPLLRHTPDPTLRSYLIDRLGPGGAEARAVIDRLSPEREPNVSARRALLLALGEFDDDRLPPAEREALVPRLLGLYRNDPDPGAHGAVGWLLRQWGQQKKVEGIDRELATGKVEGKRQWYVNGQGQTLVLVPPGEFETHSPTELGKRVKVQAQRRFALAAREVTVAEYRRFRKDHRYFKNIAPTEDCPVNLVSWYDAAAYCNWLSKEEGIAEDQWCYVSNEKGEYAAGMKIRANALGLSGYRLPTEAEWELACRAGSMTHWSMGEAEDLLGKYAWYFANSAGRSRPVGSLRPNDLGLFDLHGNDLEWCQNRYKRFPDIKDQQLEDQVDDKSSRPLRGGSFDYIPLNVHSADRNGYVPALHYSYLGFRAARTFR